LPQVKAATAAAIAGADLPDRRRAGDIVHADQDWRTP